MPKTDRTWELLQDMNKKLDLHGERLAQLSEKSLHIDGALQEARDLAHEAKGDAARIKLTMAKWSGGMAAILAGFEIMHRLVR